MVIMMMMMMMVIVMLRMVCARNTYDCDFDLDDDDHVERVVKFHVMEPE